MKTKGDILIFKTDNGNTNIEVLLEDDSLWLDQYKISELFNTDRTTIGRHINNIYKTGELEESATCAKNAQVQIEGKREVTRDIKIYNLDLIISVGYRVNSIRGTQFRIWSNKIIKEHLVKGYTINEKRLKQLQQTIQLVNRAAKQISNTDEAQGLMEVLSDYSRALDILDDYDHQKLSKTISEREVSFSIDYYEAIKAIEQLRVKFGGSSLFGNEKDQSFKSSIAVIDQTFDGKDLYPSLEEKAANLLYLVVKNHSFTDGNKRIAAWLFVWYLAKNNFLYNEDGTKKIVNNTLVALTLLIAESNPAEKEIMISVVINLMNSKE